MNLSREISYLESITSSPREFLFYNISAYRISQAIGVVTRLGIPTFLKESPKTLLELAELCETDTSNLGRLMYCMVNLGYFDLDENEKFRLNQISELLSEDSENSLAAYAIQSTFDWCWNPWVHLYSVVKEGGDGFSQEFGAGFFNFMAKNKESNKLFNQVMGQKKAIFPKIARLLQLEAGSKIIDIGGGTGGLLVEILSLNSSVSGILFDLPTLKQQAVDYIDARSASIKNRIEWIGGDFFKEVPQANVMILSEVIHDWNDRLALQILRNCRTSISSSGKIYLVERFLDEEEQKNRGNLIDLTMMVVTGGKERTVKQYRELLREAGFELLNTTSIPDSRGRILIEGIAI